jgi:hypothetical protein
VDLPFDPSERNLSARRPAMEDEWQTLVGPADSNVETTAVWQEDVI